MRKETGGPAFPGEDVYASEWREENQKTETFTLTHEGMTLRDYFAAKAMASLIIWDENDNMSYEKVAEHAYMCADAMLKERDK